MAKSASKSGLRSARKPNSSASNCSAQVSVKKEPANEEFKEFAETAMNELLGWYGYGREEMARPSSYKSNSNSNSSSPTSPCTSGCGWCGKLVDENNGLLSGQSSFCSELCFSQSRRANFKKNKTCDWCRHVRHTVSYVDFQEGASQLQFCSDKCLNQYKMHIFCRETQAHLEFHPHLAENAAAITAAAAGGSTSLITPDMWLRDCKTPERDSDSAEEEEEDRDGCGEDAAEVVTEKIQTSPLPLITLAPTSSLLTQSAINSLKRIPINNRKLKNKRKRTITTSTITQSIIDETIDCQTGPNTEEAEDLRTTRHDSNSPKLPENQQYKYPCILNSNKSQTRSSNEPHRHLQSILELPTLKTPEVESNSSFGRCHLAASSFEHRDNPSSSFGRCNPTGSRDNPSISFGRCNPTGSRDNPSSSFGRCHLAGSSFDQCDNPSSLFDHKAQTHGPTLPFSSNEPRANLFPNVIPPVTVLVPYPIMVPVPLPIPIPLPITSFLRAYSDILAANRKQEDSTLTAKKKEDLSMNVDINSDKPEKVIVTPAIVSNLPEAETTADEELIVEVVDEVDPSPPKGQPADSRLLRRRKRMADANNTSTNKGRLVKRKLV